MPSPDCGRFFTTVQNERAKTRSDRLGLTAHIIARKETTYTVMKQYIAATKAIGLAALLVLATACTSELDGPQPGTTRAIGFSPQAETRALINAPADMADGFSVWGWYSSQDGTSTNRQVFDGDLVRYADGTGWTYDDTQYWTPNSTYSFYGVYPSTGANVTCSAEDGLIVADVKTSLGSSIDDATDLMTAVTSVNYTSGEQTVQMPFRHELCRVTVMVQMMPGVKATVGVGLKNVTIGGTLTRTGDVSSWKTSGTSSQSMGPVSDLNKDYTFFDALLIPQATQDIRLDIEVQYENETSGTTTSRSIASLGTDKWERGKSYRYIATINSDYIVFDGFTVDEWDETNTGGNINIGQQ